MKPGIAKVKRIEGVLSPVITPFRKDYSPDAERFVRHCRWLLKSGCAGLAVFGTNSEANSMSVAEKRKLLEALVAGGVPAVGADARHRPLRAQRLDRDDARRGASSAAPAC